MNPEDWLNEVLPECLQALLALLRQKGLAPARATELAEEAGSFASAQMLDTKPALESQLHCRNWMIRVAKNKAIELLRTEGRHQSQLQQIHAEGQRNQDACDRAPSPWKGCASRCAIFWDCSRMGTAG
jgi:hypothetical protein